MKLKNTIGFEMTGIIKGYKESHRWNHVYEPDHQTKVLTKASANLIAFALSKLYGKRFNLDFDNRAYTDGHCVEIPSPVFSSMSAIKRFYNTTSKLFKKFNLTPKNDLTVCGGNHIHFGGLKTNEIREVFRIMVSNPWITWVFTHPDDNDSCNNFLSNERIRDGLNQSISIPPEIYSDNKVYYTWEQKFVRFVISKVKMNISDFNENKDFCICHNHYYNTLEFRCVEAPDNWKEFKKQLDFFIRLVEHAKSNARRRKATPIFCQPYTLNESINKFNELLKTLGLKPKDYAYLVKRNLEPRFEDGALPF